MKATPTFVFFLIGAISILVMSIHYFQSNDAGIMAGKEIAQFVWYRSTLRAHIIFGIFAISLGPFALFSKHTRTKRIWHKRIGYAYVGSILISGVAGLIVAQYAMGGWVARSGFTALAICWLISTSLGVYSASKRQIDLHRNWMILSYALTFAAIPQRLMLLTVFVTPISFITIYQWSAWLPWILNSAIAFYVIAKQNRQPKISVL